MAWRSSNSWPAPPAAETSPVCTHQLLSMLTFKVVTGNVTVMDLSIAVYLQEVFPDGDKQWLWSAVSVSSIDNWSFPKGNTDLPLHMPSLWAQGHEAHLNSILSWARVPVTSHIWRLSYSIVVTWCMRQKAKRLLTITIHFLAIQFTLNQEIGKYNLCSKIIIFTETQHLGKQLFCGSMFDKVTFKSSTSQLK